MFQFIESIKEKIWPISIRVRSLAAQFQNPTGVQMVLHRELDMLEFAPTRPDPMLAAMFEGTCVTQISIIMDRGRAALMDTVYNTEIKLNRREQMLLADAAKFWLSLDTPKEQVSIV